MIRADSRCVRASLYVQRSVVHVGRDTVLVGQPLQMQRHALVGRQRRAPPRRVVSHRRLSPACFRIRCTISGVTKGVQTGAVATGHSRQWGAEQRRQNIGSRPSDHYFRSVCLSVCLFVCLYRVFLRRLRSDLDKTRTHVTCPGLVVSPRI